MARYTKSFVDNLMWCLKAFGAPKVLLLAVLLTIWTEIPTESWQDETSFSFVEVFAGQAEVTRMFRFANLPAARLDLLYMDAEPGKQNPMNLLSDAGMGTALAAMLRGNMDEGWLTHFGLKCSSNTAVNAGTSSRSKCSSIGNLDYQSVRDSNCLGSRTILLMMVAICLNACIMLEQPFSSFFEYYPRWRDFMRMLQYHGGLGAVHKTSWFMYHYGHETPKRMYAFANSRHVGQLNQGQLLGWTQKKQVLKDKGKSKELVVRYQDAQGKQRWKGSSQLRSSECYPPKFGLKMVEIFHALISEKSGMPQLPQSVPPAEATFSSLDYEDVWSEAGLISVCRYLRGGVHLRIPPTFRDLLPKKL